ncbi:HlyD family efflux transporter periplasmic adaptor subunit [Candidatus Thiothrix sp. Deng01]|uniref:HlyD family efflux transporter periplasmic adaptor subunit n=1 Tax=Candidatus Thiothrix phosphatis TaxID=3112415 RepID=A0ABU6D3E3_9GAMM|nr:HlyD family efflux transporter periplasmic adaptor subunit [Candidatus Thiothrix sp. Deng01]MEB4592849.1 HlyD family efflux transporter periplasmic adaptor subunit [Candidatus Thiothrix sp. Deng01]
MSQPESTPPSAPSKPGSRRLKALTLLLLFFGSIGVVWFIWWFAIAQWREDTDNAYVVGNVVQVTPQTTGTVVAVNVNNTDRVAKGQLLAQLDETDAKVALQSAEAALADAVRSVRGLYASTSQSDAGIVQANADLNRARHQAEQAEAQRRNAEDEYNRLANLRQQKFVSVESLNQAQTALQAAEASLAAAQSAVNAAKAALQKAQAQQAGAAGQTENTSIEGHPKVQAAAAQVRQAYLALARTRILAPVGGDVAQRSAQVGARVAPGTALMAIVPPEQMWVDANFKETQLDDVRIGQPVKLTADLYGGSVQYHGKVAGFAAGTGSAFALLPAQNASGNWIKIVQRVPVRIELEPETVRQHPLRIGLSMRVVVDTHDRSGPVIASGSGEDKATLSSTDVFAQQAQQADAVIAQVIADNSGKAVQ